MILAVNLPANYHESRFLSAPRRAECNFARMLVRILGRALINPALPRGLPARWRTGFKGFIASNNLCLSSSAAIVLSLARSLARSHAAFSYSARQFPIHVTCFRKFATLRCHCVRIAIKSIRKQHRYHANIVNYETMRAKLRHIPERSLRLFVFPFSLR